MNQKSFPKKGNILKSFLQSKKGQYSLFSLLTLSVLLISGLFTFSLLQNTDTALAALNCPAGSTVSGNTCISNTPSSYTCPAGQTVSGTSCITTSCPQGGDLSGGSCVASNASPVQTNDACPVYTFGGATLQSEALVSGISFCFTEGAEGSNASVTYNINNCNLGYDSNIIQNYNQPTYGIPVNYFGSTGSFVSSFGGAGSTYQSPNGICAGVVQYALGANNEPDIQRVYAYWKKGLYTSVYSYTATTTTTGSATPVYGTAVTPTSYTPEPGQITGLTCTPSSVVASGTVNCSGQATGAPSGVPYAGNITVTIDNGGGSITTTINPDGTFTASSVPVGTTTGTKAATTNLGGTTSITVTAASITVDPDLASGPGSLSNSTDCTSAKNVTIGTVYTCSFPINGTGPFVLPAGGIQARTNQSANNSTPVNTCTIAASVLTCTGITTVGTPSTLIAGTGNVQLGKGTTPATWNTKGVVTLVAATSPLTTTDIPSLTVTCGVGGTPGTVRVNTTTTCTFTLPTNKTLPNNFKLGIGNATPAGTCTVGTGINSSLVTCINVPTGTLLGTQPINGQIGTETITPTGETVNVIDSLCSTTNPCALFETALTYNPTQALAKRYGASGSTNSDNLILTLKDTRLEQSGFTTTCSIKYKFRTDTSYRILTTNSTYNNTTGCTGNLLKANQLLFNVDFEITAITTNTTTNTTKNYLIYSNYDFKAGSIGVTSIGGSGL